jgi:hypothetical protein
MAPQKNQFFIFQILIIFSAKKKGGGIFNKTKNSKSAFGEISHKEKHCHNDQFISRLY